MMCFGDKRRSSVMALELVRDILRLGVLVVNVVD